MIPNYPWTLFVLEVLLAVHSDSAQIDFRDIVKENKKLCGFNFTHTDRLCPLRIVGGFSADIELIPYQVSLRSKIWGGLYYNSFCGGAIVTPYYVLTAAHCFEKRRSQSIINSLMVVAGTTKTYASAMYMKIYEQHSRIKVYYEHPKFNLERVIHDFGIIELKNAFTFTKKVWPIRMHTADLNLKISTGTWCIVSGFGRMENGNPSETLKMVCVPVISPRKCKQFYSPYLIHDSTICAGSLDKDSCSGDSGGPLLCAGVLVGLVSWGGPCGELAGVYTRISSYATGKYLPLFQAKAADPYCYCLLNSWLALYLWLLSVYFCDRLF